MRGILDEAGVSPGDSIQRTFVRCLILEQNGAWHMTENAGPMIPTKRRRENEKKTS